uniref:Uncharacterized protein n=1 Tax=Anguilla anguilla TaxID=7936 RepID=A0A0E9TV71_ANGAN
MPITTNVSQRYKETAMRSVWLTTAASR